MANFWDSRFAGPVYLYGTEPNDFLREHAEQLPLPGPVLSLAEGEGRNAVFLASRGYRVTAMDSSAVGLEKARQLATARGVGIETVHADLSDFQLGEVQWAGVISIWCHLPSGLRADVHGRIRRAIAPGGVFLLEHYHPRQVPYGTGGPKDPDMLVTLAELRAAFPGWIELHAFEGERVIHEGELHEGVSFVTQWVARRPSQQE